VFCVANGNLDHAFEIDPVGYGNGTTWKKEPRQFPLISPRTKERPKAFVPACNHRECWTRPTQIGSSDAVQHGNYCDGSFPLWECKLVLRLLSPGLLLKDITSECRSLILASGSLAPLPSLCAELDLHGQDPSVPSSSQSPSTKNSSSPANRHPLSSSIDSPTVNTPKQTKLVGRLQTKPKPLEANHVIDLKKQLLAVSIGHFADGEPLTVTYNQYKHDYFFSKLGDSIASVVECIPRGGVLIFLPSYTFLNKCVSIWKAETVWSRLLNKKGKIIVEPTKSQEEFEIARNDFQDTIKATGSCILLAVFRGKMSEGISFNDDNARGVICVGMPYPNARDRGVLAKKAYNEEQRKLRKNTCLLPGMEWYSQQAYRAIAQALGRCIRHQADYGTVILMDSRHCDDGSPNEGICRAHKNLPKWMRHNIRTLSVPRKNGVGNNNRFIGRPTREGFIEGGYAGLGKVMKEFFAECPKVSQAVRDKWKLDLENANKRSSQTDDHVFNKATGGWTVAASAASTSASTPSKTEQPKTVVQAGC